ncbi:hypothetical protein M3P21_17120 [Ruegeria sp. 2012CJ41-6]|uniref:Uncharacterized protein n=1 Tax=Ruegeria spongiae TaxID=2942209 RepID=A0ABT0Q6R3_9RHOB|nr:hypothetical protein [Ruegeria spongiae]MCL6285252.1 hypothetical protein [Ruegeria spongiae]
MYITFTPVRRHDRLTIEKSGDVLTINGEDFDFSPIPEGATLPRTAVTCDWLASDVERHDGHIHLTLCLPHGPSAPSETLFPVPVRMTGDGQVPLPPHGTTSPEIEEESA